MVNNRRKRKTKKKVCAFCADKNSRINYKEIQKLKKYVTERGKILPRRISGNCSIHQKDITVAIKRARHMALLPYTVD